MSAGFTHLGADGAARMVDVGEKRTTRRVAVAAGRIRMQPSTLDAVLAGGIAKGEVLQVARIAGIQAAKRTGELIPLCHPLGLDFIQVFFQRRDEATLDLFAGARLSARTGIEMEALTAVTVAGLTIYDMCKAVDKGMVLGDVRLIFKSGGKSTYCECSGTIQAAQGAPSATGRVGLEATSARPSAAEDAQLEVQGIPFELLPEDLWLVGPGGFRAALVPGPALVLDSDCAAKGLPAVGTTLVLRTGDSYGGNN